MLEVRSKKKTCDTRTNTRLYTCKYRWRVLTAEGLLQAPELHGCSVGRESDVVEVGWREKDKDTDEISFRLDCCPLRITERRRTADSLTQRLVELGHLGVVPACRLGLVAGEGQKKKKRQKGQMVFTVGEESGGNNKLATEHVTVNPRNSWRDFAAPSARPPVGPRRPSLVFLQWHAS